MLQGEHSSKLWTFIKLQSVIKIFVLSNFEWRFCTSFTVLYPLISTGSIQEVRKTSNMTEKIVDWVLMKPADLDLHPYQKKAI